MAQKVQFDEIDDGLDKLSEPTYDSLIDLMISFSDAIILSSDKTSIIGLTTDLQ